MARIEQQLQEMGDDFENKELSLIEDDMVKIISHL